VKPKQRWAILGSLLFATLLAGYLIDDEPVPAKTARQRGAATKAVGVGENAVRRGEAVADKKLAAASLQFPEPPAADAAGAAEPGIDPFRAKSWYVAPPPPPPAKPKAPPLPFQYLGKLNEDGEIRVFLNHQGKHLIARVGDIINDTYRVEEIAGGRMTFLYQPLKEIQVLAIGTEK
jgi:hypothetical protein